MIPHQEYFEIVEKCPPSPIHCGESILLRKPSNADMAREKLLGLMEGRRLFEGVRTGFVHLAKVEVTTEPGRIVCFGSFFPTEIPQDSSNIFVRDERGNPIPHEDKEALASI